MTTDVRIAMTETITITIGTIIILNICIAI